MKFASLFALLILAAAAYAEPVPKGLLDPSLHPQVLDLGPGTSHELLAQMKVENTTYYLVLQKPPIGNWSYVLVSEKEGEQPKFLVNGGTKDIFNLKSARVRELPAAFKETAARALVAQEIGPEKPGLTAGAPVRVTSDYRHNLIQQWESLPEPLKKEYLRRGLHP